MGMSVQFSRQAHDDGATKTLSFPWNAIRLASTGFTLLPRWAKI